MSQKLSSVMVATRKIINEETGIDLFVYEERKNIASKRTIRGTYYNIIVVSNLPDFKAKSGETVQYTLDKSHDEFEKLYQNLSKKFSGTLIPEIPSKPIAIMDTVEKAKERKQKLDKFVKFCAMTSKIAKSEHLRKFLGVEGLKIDEEADDLQKSDKLKDVIKVTTPKVRSDLFKDSIDTTSVDLFVESEAAEDVVEVIKQGHNLAIKDAASSAPTAVRLFEGNFEDSEAGINIVQDSAKNAKESNKEQKEETYSDVEDSDDDLEELLNRLENAKKTRTERDKVLDEKSNSSVVPSEEKYAEKDPNIGDLHADDVARYISENTVKINDLDLGL